MPLNNSSVRQRFTFSMFVAAVLAVMTLHCPSVRADNAERPLFSLAGFGTLGATRSSENQADFTTAYYHPNGAGYTRQWSNDIDTVLGLQLTANLTDKLSAVVQLVSEQQWRNSYRPNVEWANVKYAFTPDFSVRAGRIILPTLLASDSGKVGYTNVWVRPPLETSTIYQFSNSDGIDATYRFRIGEATNTITAIYGRNDATTPDGTSEGFPTEIRRFVGIVNRFEYGPATLHVAFEKAKTSQPKLAEDPDPSVAMLGHFPITVAAVGASYDPGNWFVTGEWAKIVYGEFGSRAAWHVGGGYRIGKFTPYASYASRGRLTGPFDIDGSDPQTQTTTSLGMRWDFMKNADLKLQYDRIRFGQGSSGLLIDLQPGFQPGGKVNLISIVLDFVF